MSDDGKDRTGRTPEDDATSTRMDGDPPTFPSLDRPPERGVIGDYRILRQIGEGGMGVVYEAQQQNPRREVALKVVRGGTFVDPRRVRMFEREAEALARLKHSGIAAIYESGRTGDGQPFFAMELVRGRTLREFITDKKAGGAMTPADMRDRLELFLQVCGAVSYAHQRGVIHRDLKPSNVIVLPAVTHGSTHASRASVKILDFGIARITDTELGSSTIETEVGHVKGTLPYMSPEQIRGNPDEIDVRTDVYSLGVLLYELLTGDLPHDVRNATFPEGARVICEQPPRALARTWTGTRRPDRDAETIVMKALEKDPARRYQSVAALADDIERFLHDQPILARPPSATYQLRKMIARHRVGFGFAVTVAVLIVAFGAGMAWLARSLAVERDRANRQAETAAQVSRFLIDLFRVPDPGESKGNTVTAREILDRGAERIRLELSDEPEVRAGLMGTMGEVYSNLGLYDDARDLLEEAHRTRVATPGTDAGEVAASLLALSSLAERRGDYRESERLAREALALQRRGGGEDPEVASSLQFVAMALKHQDRLDAAETLYREALKIRLDTLGERDERTASTLTSLAELLRVRNRDGDLVEAEALHRRALDITREIHGPVHPSVVSCLNNLALTLQDRGDLAGAESLLREALETNLRLHGERHPGVAQSMNNLAALIRDSKPDEAEALHRRALAIRREMLGDHHPEVASSLNNLAVLLQDKGELGEAETLMREALAIVRDLLGDRHPRVGVSLYNLGRLLCQKGDWTGAAATLREALPIVEASSPPGHWRPGNVRSLIGDCLSRSGRHAEAEPLLLEGFEIVRADRGDDDPRTVATLRRIVAMYERWGKPADAEAYRSRLPD